MASSAISELVEKVRSNLDNVTVNDTRDLLAVATGSLRMDRSAIELPIGWAEVETLKLKKRNF